MLRGMVSIVEERGDTERLILLTTLPVTLEPLTRTCNKIPIAGQDSRNGQDSENGQDSSNGQDSRNGQDSSNVIKTITQTLNSMLLIMKYSLALIQIGHSYFVCVQVYGKDSQPTSNEQDIEKLYALSYRLT